MDNLGEKSTLVQKFEDIGDMPTVTQTIGQHSSISVDVVTEYLHNQREGRKIVPGTNKGAFSESLKLTEPTGEEKFVKVLKDSLVMCIENDCLSINNDQVLKFEQEYKILQQLTNKGISDIPKPLEYICIDTEINWPAIAMGIALEHLGEEKPFTYLFEQPLLEKVNFLLNLTKTLSKIHNEGIIHRDLKPENLFLYERKGKPRVKIIDFGLARIIKPDDNIAKPKSEIVGTPGYMPFEAYIDGQFMDKRSDVYSLGCIAFHALTGKHPYAEFDTFQEKRKMTAEANNEYVVEELRSINIPDALKTVIRRSMDKNQEYRQSSMDVFAFELLKSVYAHQ